MTEKKKTSSSKDQPSYEITHSTELKFHLDDKKIEQIKKCLEKGTLSITVSKIDLLQGGRAVDPYVYD
jgi:anti-sigma28 factor (negative regulator of flagellin synthesis)